MIERHQYIADLNDSVVGVDEMVAAMVRAAVEHPDSQGIRLDPGGLVGIYGTGEGQFEFSVEVRGDGDDQESGGS